MSGFHFTRIGRAPSRQAAAQPPPTSETLTLDTTTGPVTSGSVLAAGVAYTVTVQGTWSDWNGSLSVGTPEPDAAYPTSTVGRKSTQVGLDADTCFAHPLTSPAQVGHWTQLQFSVDGLTWQHVEPVGGPYDSPAAGHLYTYRLVGQGKPLGIRVADTPLSDNYGALRVTVAGASAPVPAPAPAPTPSPIGLPSPNPVPTTQPPPTNGGTVSGTVLFDGRAKRMSSLYSYETTPGDLTTLHHGQDPVLWDGLLFLDNDISLVPDSHYGKAYKCAVKIGDHAPHNVGAPATNGAAELSKRRPNELGKWDYFALACKVPSWTNVAGIGFATIASVGYETLKGDQVGLGLIPSGGTLHFQVHQNSGHIDTSKGISTPTVFYRSPLMPVTYGQWREFVLAVKWAMDNTGAVQVWSRLPGGTFSKVFERLNTPTYLWGINGNYAPVTEDMSSTPQVLDKIGLYYNLNGAKGSETAYLSGITRCTTLDTAVGTLP